MPAQAIDSRLQLKREAALARLETIANALDDGVPVPFTDFKVGLDPVFNLIPGGNLFPVAIGAYTIFEAVRLDVPLPIILKMIGRILLDALLGAIPVIGTIFDVFFKAHRLNVDELVEYLNTEEARRASES